MNMHLNIISLCPIRGTELGEWPMENQSALLMEFILLGFPLSRQVELLFLVFLLPAFLLMLLGNLLIISVVLSWARLHTSMYFFLCSLFILDILFTSVISPKHGPT